ncbi:uncharacterized protein RAG0_17119 [Rhynchosporium agropyri]|uniref:Uncharacterized protein n=1 Tax=Rhynchosporium agropyri TaxID=914238 RepID=A0A1E1LSZ4_9HELO|nr:uncharacterized protein RAG0_17119 [Rhynchosporium agropyri]
MGSRKRINNFCGTDAEYIEYLESKVCQLSAIESPPSPARSVVREDAINNCDSGKHPTTTLAFIEYDPHTDGIDRPSQSPASKRQRTQPRWEREMDEMLRDFPDTRNWASKRKEVGLTSADSILRAFDILIHGKESQTEAALIEANFSMFSADRVLQLLNNFAVGTAALQIDQTFTTQIYHFRVFVFVSLCCVALHQCVDTNLVEEVMAKCVSASSAKNLSKLRSGALWVNKMMSRLAARGLDHRAYELFILSGRPIAQYSRFSHAKDGDSYFQARFTNSNPETEIQASLPFWVPFIIKTIVGDIFSLPAICTALGYDSDSQMHDYPRYLYNYHHRQLPLPRPTTDPQGDESNYESNHDGRVDTEVPTSGLYRTGTQALLDAARKYAVEDFQPPLYDLEGIYWDMPEWPAINNDILDMSRWQGQNFCNAL